MMRMWNKLLYLGLEVEFVFPNKTIYSIQCIIIKHPWMFCHVNSQYSVYHKRQNHSLSSIKRWVLGTKFNHRLIDDSIEMPVTAVQCTTLNYESSAMQLLLLRFTPCIHYRLNLRIFKNRIGLGLQSCNHRYPGGWSWRIGSLRFPRIYNEFNTSQSN